MNEQYAVLDLGSNSFRLLLARQQGELVQVVERVKEKVQLVRNFRDGRLDRAAIERAADCLRRYAQRLKGLPRSSIAMVGTYALRAAENRAELIEAAESIMGAPLRILSGQEEAALIYRGVHMREPPGRRMGRYIMDIGGGSTELAWGSAAVPNGVRSCPEGCVSLADRFFRRDVPLTVAFDSARAYLQDTLPLCEPVGPHVEVIGTSGTIESVQAVLAANGWSDREITAAGLAHLVNALFDGRWDAEAGLLGLAPDRVDIFPAGVALLDMLFRRLDISVMRYVGAALEDGVLHGMLAGAGDPYAVRQATVRGLQERYGVDGRQAQRVRGTATALFDQAQAWWLPEATLGDPELLQLLGWGADLHELGLAVSPRAYHRHGGYLLKHADMRGFSALEREYLALLVRAHRRGLPMLAFSGLATRDHRQLLRLVALLRIAVILERSHAEGESPVTRLEVVAMPTGDRLTLVLPRGWLDAHPLSRRELEVEPVQLTGAGIRLDLVEA